MVVAVDRAAAMSASSAASESLLLWSDVRSRNVTRALQKAVRPRIGVQDRRRTGTFRLAAPHITSIGAEAPRPARARIDGRSPGSRVGAHRRLPGGDPSGLAWARRLQLRGQLRHRNGRSAPHSLFALLREAVDADS